MFDSKPKIFVYVQIRKIIHDFMDSDEIVQINKKRKIYTKINSSFFVMSLSKFLNGYFSSQFEFSAYFYAFYVVCKNGIDSHCIDDSKYLLPFISND